MKAANNMKKSPEVRLKNALLLAVLLLLSALISTPPVKAAQQPSQTGKGNLSPTKAATMGVNMAESLSRNVPLDVAVFSKPMMVLQFAMKAHSPSSKPAKATLEPVAVKNRFTGQADEEGWTAGAAASKADAVAALASC